jgi:hypothetical protein
MASPYTVKYTLKSELNSRHHQYYLTIFRGCACVIELNAK